MLLKACLVAFLVLGLLMAGFGVYFLSAGFSAHGWPTTEGKVPAVSIRVDTDVSESGRTTPAQRERLRRYFPSITYLWTVGKETLSGSRYRLGEPHEKYRERAEAVAAAAKFPEGSAITVHYDPDHPSQAVLNPAVSGGVFVPLPLGLLILVMGWFGLKHRESIAKALRTSKPSAATVSADGSP